MAFGSVSIVKTDANDTIRIINLCNMDNYAKGEKVYFIPAEKPPFNVILPSSLVRYQSNDTIFEQPSEYDLKIINTTWASAIK